MSDTESWNNFYQRYFVEKKPKDHGAVFLNKCTGFSIKFTFGMLHSSGPTPALGTIAVNPAFFLVCFVAHKTIRRLSAQGFPPSALPSFLLFLPSYLPPFLPFFLSSNDTIFQFSSFNSCVYLFCYRKASGPHICKWSKRQLNFMHAQYLAFCSHNNKSK